MKKLDLFFLVVAAVSLSMGLCWICKKKKCSEQECKNDRNNNKKNIVDLEETAEENDQSTDSKINFDVIDSKITEEADK